MSLLKNERGMVLLLVLLVVALLATVLTELSFSTLVDMRLAETFRDTTRATYLSRGGLEVGRMLLQDDDNNYDATDELWAIGIQQYPVADGSVTVEIVDLGGQVALNLLVKTDGKSGDAVIMDRYRRLLVELDASNPDALIATLMDWIDTDGYLRNQGAENAHYISSAEPIQCKNGPLDTLDELALVEGYSPELLKKLLPHVTAYGSWKVNVNTASREVLLSLGETTDIDSTEVDALLEARQKEPFVNYSQVKQQLRQNSILLNTHYGFKSQYYKVESTGRVNDGRTTLLAVVNKVSNKILFQRVM
jgi:general secretion pathway protein K